MTRPRGPHLLPDDARVAAGRVATDVAQATVQGDQDPACRRGCGDDFGVERAGQTLVDDAVDVMACGFQDGGGRGGQVLVEVEFTGSAGSGGVPRGPARRRRQSPAGLRSQTQSALVRGSDAKSFGRALWRARTRAEHLTWASTLGARALSPRLPARRTWKSWCSGTRSRCCAVRSPARSRTGLTGP